MQQSGVLRGCAVPVWAGGATSVRFLQLKRDKLICMHGSNVSKRPEMLLRDLTDKRTGSSMWPRREYRAEAKGGAFAGRRPGMADQEPAFTKWSFNNVQGRSTTYRRRVKIRKSVRSRQGVNARHSRACLRWRTGDAVSR